MGKKSRQKKEAREKKEQERRTALRAMSAQIESIREKYANDWSDGHAARFSAAGHYQWMADFVAGRELVLEVGTGDGSGTIALLAKGARTVVSIESNPQCLDRAYQKLTQGGIPVTREHRGVLTVNQANVAQIRWDRVNSSIPERGVLLLGGDMLADTELKSWLIQQTKFDAVVCWNIGASAVENTAAENEGDYRLRVQNKVYDLADQILKPGGILHIVDRGRDSSAGPEQELREAWIGGHQEQASTTSLQVSLDVQSRSYTPPPAGVGVAMKALDTTKFAHDPNKAAFWSAVATKP